MVVVPGARGRPCPVSHHPRHHRHPKRRARGIAVCKVDPGTKRAFAPGWTTRSAEVNDFANGDVIGIQTGWLSDLNTEDPRANAS